MANKDKKRAKKLRKMRPEGKEAVKNKKIVEPIPGMLIRQGHRHDHHIPLTEPNWVTVENAENMRPDDPVLGFHVKDQSYAIPWWVIKNHHVANLTLQKTPVFIALCEACSSSCAYIALIDDKRLNFEVAGAYKGTFVVKDYETESIWAPFLGESLVGELKGKKLEQFPIYQSEWQEWSQLYPKTLVPDGEGESRDGHGWDRSPGSYENPDGVRGTLKHRDERLPHSELVLGVHVNGDEIAFPLKDLPQDQTVVSQTIGRENVAVFYRPNSWMAMAFFGKLNGETLEFTNDAGKIIDAKTGSSWDMKGECVEGEHVGKKLTFAQSGIEEWHIWASYHPETKIFESTAGNS